MKDFDFLKRYVLRSQYVLQFSNAMRTHNSTHGKADGGLARDPSTADLSPHSSLCAVSTL